MTDDELRAELEARHSAVGVEPPEVVKQVQHFLNTHGYQPALVEDGTTGPKTNAAVLWWQQNNGLTADGLIGPQTVASMGIHGLPPSRIPTVKGPAIPGLRQSVVDAFPAFSATFEGKALPYPYTDSKGFVTTGTGNLMEPFTTFAAQPWRHGVNGPLATQAEKQSAYDVLKGEWPNVQSVASQSLTDLRLNPEDLNNILYRTLAGNNDYLKAHIPGYTQSPSDAQLAHNSMAWAWGEGFAGVWDRLFNGLGTAYTNAVASNDFTSAADIMEKANAHEMTINHGIIARVAATKQLLLNAADAVKKKANFDELFYPGPVDTALLVAAGIGAWFAGGILFMAGLFGYRYYKENF